MAEEVEFELQRTSPPAKVAERLRRLADQLESGTITLDEDEIAVPEKLALKIEFEEQYEGEEEQSLRFEIEIELKWPIQMGQD
jgi:amphi-Trp domain-containing protein